MRPGKVIAALKAPRFQVWLSLTLLIASTVLLGLAITLHWLDNVAFVSILSVVALQLAALSGLVAALVALDNVSGFTLNQADKVWLEQMVERKLRG